VLTQAKIIRIGISRRLKGFLVGQAHGRVDLFPKNTN